MGQTKMLETEKTFRCRSCGDLFSVKCDYEQFYRLDRPISCPNLRVVEQRCKGSQFDPVTTDVNSDMCRDYQEIKIQEKVGSLTLGTIPRSIWVTLEDDLVDACKPGDDLTVIGVVARRWRPVNKFSESQRTNIALAVRANHVKVNNDQRATNIMSDEQTKEFEAFWDKWKWDPLEGRNRILASLCPQVCFCIFASLSDPI
jgi:DNA helicase MCM9